MECPVCFEIFQDPLLLPGCGHTICAHCAEQLVTEGNFLRCPECRLVYQLRQGVKSLPKNVALQRTIDEHTQNSSRINLMCEQHPDDAVSLYCKTCEKSICLKCYFSNTLRRGQSMHSGHQVDTSEDAFSKERRLLEEKWRHCENNRTTEKEYIAKLEETEKKLKDILEEKLALIDKNKNDMISQVKQTTGKLKFTLKGSVARDMEFLQMALESSKGRLEVMESGTEEADDVYAQAIKETVDINTLKEARSKLEEIPDIKETDRPAVDTFLKVAQFDPDLDSCIRDQKRALAYQTEAPRAPTICEEECVISDTSAFIVVQYNEIVRVKKLAIYHKEAMFKGMSQKDWQTVEIADFSRGFAKVVIRNLAKGTMYRLYAVAMNDFGDSAASPELYFRTVDAEIEIRTVAAS